MDYILVPKRQTASINNSILYAGTTAESDHRIVIADVKKKHYHRFTTKKKNRTKKYETSKLKLDEDAKTNYQSVLTEQLSQLVKPDQTTAEKWGATKAAMDTAAMENIGLVERTVHK